VNGASPASPTTTIYACLEPDNVAAPTKISTTTTSITIGWTEPSSNGCPITGFSIYRDTGSNDPLTVNVDAASVEGKPSLREYTISPLSPTSSTFRFKVRAHNNAGYTDSSPLSVVLAAVPNTPGSGPTSDSDITDDTQIGVIFGPLTTG